MPVSPHILLPSIITFRDQEQSFMYFWEKFNHELLAHEE